MPGSQESNLKVPENTYMISLTYQLLWASINRKNLKLRMVFLLRLQEGGRANRTFQETPRLPSSKHTLPILAQ